MHPLRTLASLACCAGPFITFGYLAACRIWPFKNCPRCGGTGRHPSPSGRAYRHCRRCKGTGGRFRLGVLINNRLRRLVKSSH